MGEPIRSNALAALLKLAIGGSGEGYSFPLGNGRGPIVLREDASPFAEEHERMHLDAGFNPERNSTIDTMIDIPPPNSGGVSPFSMFPPLSVRQRSSPEYATQEMNADDERALRRKSPR